ncbi:LysR substrate-binding domain-containing protein [Labrys wisconsinensis]|uniref:DNA-binding transcriptional LysR family regulator n=1 Tax=Labrys wisconsinensis TaxID=425677 RepID=A0ABU0J070_9HYPH|nr:LysR substrate-binding domain-containing protein [Labrys wisconsinensis]MDQ0467667.1 DNA-binding transcriptional LysR family regulator [Labrys wisconsinensis]
MDRRWLPLNALRAFEAVGRHGSFTAAAQSLLVSQSAVSRHVIGLEEFLGVALFDRKPQQPVLTEAGRRLLPVVEKALDRIDGTLEEILRERGKPRRSLRVLLPTTFAQRLAVPLLRDFRAEFPDVTLDIDSRPVPGSAEREVDVAVVYSPPRVAPQVLDLLWMVRLTVLCHPAVAARGPASDVAAFVAANDLLHVKVEGRSQRFLWETFARTVGLSPAQVDRGLVFDTAQLAAQYALSGEGIALVDPVLFQDDIAAGRLARPFDIDVDDGYGYYLAIHPDDLDRPEIALFRTWLIRRFSRPFALPDAQPKTR